MADIVWKRHPVHSQLEANALGDVRRVGSSKSYVGTVHVNYLFISPRLATGKKRLAVHILVWECFNDVHDHKLFHVHHRDHDRANNHLSNLQKLLKAEHMRHHALLLDHTSKANKQSKKVAYQDAHGNSGIFPSVRAAAEHLNVSRDVIARRISGTVAIKGYALRAVLEGEAEDEEWRSVPCGPAKGLHVSHNGRVRSRGYYNTYGNPDNSGYLHFSKWGVHYLVCYAFHGPPPTPAHTSVDHINRNRADNRAANLRWATPQTQADNGSSKGVEEYDLTTNEVLNTWISAAAAERETGIHNQTISLVCTLTRRKDKGFISTIGPRKSGFRFTGLTRLQQRRIRELYLFTDKFRLPNGIHPIKRHGGRFTYYMFTKTLGGRTRTYTKTFKDREACVTYNRAWHAAHLLQSYWRIHRAFKLV